ncbi:T9SS type A sorting domain-containing protein [Polaribacter sargassicola]|uniref:T9SS type A sorting domain-containing protein n=1 Tax=Polaribacter sargassicola TaxID=2836891 RepID=UPI001F195C5D|nr:T9SS type A sorting domain-containing protein [Polaribacter sp. DS7-9]MCG1035114.1 T9SS type A sorting domain-containing protein [Polaribacter sp. DS7-9]
MNKNITFLFFYFFLISIVQAQSIDWLTQFGGTSEDVLFSVAIDNDGNTYSVGYYAETSTFNETELNALGYFNSFITKTDATGNIIWAKSLGQPDDDDIDVYHSVITKSISVDADGNVIVAGYFDAGEFDADPGEGTHLLSSDSYEMFVLKLDTNGNFIWANSFGSSEDGFENVSDIGVDANGDIYLTGYFQNSISMIHAAGTLSITSNGFSDVFVIKYTSDGYFSWMKNMGGTEGDLGMNIDVTSTGDVYVTGRYEGIATFYTPIFMGSPVQLSTTDGYKGTFALKLDAYGEFKNVVKVGEAESESIGTSIAVDTNGYAYVTGYYGGILTANEDTAEEIVIDSNNNYESYIAKVDFTNQNVTWIKEIDGETDSSFGFNVDLDSNNNIYVVGFYSETLTAGSFNLTKKTPYALESYLISMDDSGEFLGAYQFGGVNAADSQVVVIDKNDNIILAGSFRETVDISPYSSENLEITSLGFRDNYILSTKINNVLDITDNLFVNGLKIYPNPSEEIVYISSDIDINGLNYTVYDISGKSILRGIIKESKEININHLKSGLYFLQIKNTDNSTQTLKISKR